MRCVTLAMVIIVYFSSIEAITVSGVFTDYLTDQPINECHVRLDGFSPGASIYSTVSDSTGRYVFSDLSAGVFKLVVEDSRYAPDTLWITVEKDTAIPFVLNERSHLLDSIPDTLLRAYSPSVGE